MSAKNLQNEEPKYKKLVIGDAWICPRCFRQNSPHSLQCPECGLTIKGDVNA